VSEIESILVLLFVPVLILAYAISGRIAKQRRIAAAVQKYSTPVHVGVDWAKRHKPIRVVPYKEWASQQLVDTSRKMLLASANGLEPGHQVAIGGETFRVAGVNGNTVTVDRPLPAIARTILEELGEPFPEETFKQFNREIMANSMGGAGGYGSVSTASYPGDVRHDDQVDASAWAMANLRRAHVGLDLAPFISTGHAKVCAYCGSPSHHMHKFREREVCSGCGQFWEA
jgi:hypothetical protein